MSHNGSVWRGDIYAPEALNGKVIGEFVCNKITDYGNSFRLTENNRRELARRALLEVEELQQYCTSGNLYGWDISQLTVYDRSKELCEFMFIPKSQVGAKEPSGMKRIHRSPQSWWYACHMREI